MSPDAQILPDGFLANIRRQLGVAEGDALANALQGEPVVGVRHNVSKPRSEMWEGAQPVAWNPDGFILAKRPDFTLDPQWHQGRYYVQEPASMAVGAVVDYIIAEESEGVSRVMDLCAAPGGKTTALIDRLPAGALMIANEYDPRRASILAENVAKWGASDVVVTQGATGRLCDALEETFDIVLADVPCSGEGMMRREPMARTQWSQGLVESCARLQREILADAVRALRPGGWLIFSTCTFNDIENESNVAWLREKYGLEVDNTPLTKMPGVVPGSEGGVHFFSHRTHSEGLFISLLRKGFDLPGANRGRHVKEDKGRRRGNAKFFDKDFPWAKLDDMTFSEGDGGIWAIGSRHKGIISLLERKAKVLIPGMHIATRGKRGFEPSHEIAMSRVMNRDVFEELELDTDDALRYLARQTDIKAQSSGLANGLVLATFRGEPLGWLKRIGVRYNNLYPMNWRIRKAIK